MLQASIIALALGFLFRHSTVSQPTSWWAHALFAYALVAAVVPWLSGGIMRQELSLVSSVVIGVVFALPVWVASRWLADSPYQLVVTIARVLLWMWMLHFAISVALWALDKAKGTPRPQT